MTDDTEVLVRKDSIDNARKKVKPKGLLTGDECVVTKCKVKDDNALLQDKIHILEREALRLRKEIEIFNQSLEKELNEEEKAKVLRKAMESNEVQIQRKIVAELKSRNEKIQAEFSNVINEYHEYKEDQDRIMTSFEADRKIQEKVKIIKALRDKRDQLLVENEKLEISIDKANLQYHQLSDAHNQLLAEYKTLRKKVEQLKMIDKKGIQLKPLPDNVTKPAKKKRWFPIRLTLRN